MSFPRILGQRSVIPRICKDDYEIEIIENVPIDDRFSFPKQCNYAAALGKVLIANSGVPNVHLRYPDISFYSKFMGSLSSLQCIDCDSLYIYAPSSTAALTQRNINTYDVVRTVTLGGGSLRMIDFASDPTYGYVTSNNATDGHGVRMIRKSDMTVVASLLATGSGDGQFSNPLGVKYYDGHLYVCDTSNNRIVKLDVVRTAGSEAISFDSNIDTIAIIGGAVLDICTDGSYWYMIKGSDTNLAKRNLNFSSAGVSNVAVGNGLWSICYIPDQSDGNGSTLCIVNNSVACLYRRKCSDLSPIITVGSSGDSSSSLFDPTFTTSVSTTMTFTSDDGITYTTPAGTSHVLSLNGFAAAFHRTAGPHRWVVRCAAGLGAITGIDAPSDAIMYVKNLNRTVNLVRFIAYTNPSLTINVADVCRATNLDVSGLKDFVGPVSSLSRSLVSILTQGMKSIVGSLIDFPHTLQTAYTYVCTGITAASIAHLTAIRDLRIYSMWSSLTAEESVDIVINSIWAARMNYTYATPNMQIGGTNKTPTGNYISPVEGSDWHFDGLKWIPLTPKAKIYDLCNDVNGEGFRIWGISYT